MGAIVVFGGFGLIYVGIPWLVAWLGRDILASIGLKHPAITVALFIAALLGVWTLRSDPNFWFHADQIEKFTAAPAAPPNGVLDISGLARAFAPGGRH